VTPEIAPPYTHHAIATDDGALNVVQAGQGPALLLLHGWTLDWRMWRPQMAALAGDHHVIALDRRGFGASTAPAGLGREADDLLRVLDALGVADAVVVGMSQAARVALDVAWRFPDRVRGVVLQGAPYPGLPVAGAVGEEIPVAAYAALARAGSLADLRAQWGAHPLMRVFSESARALTAELLSAYTGRDLLQSGVGPDLRDPDLAAIAAPTLVVTGALDTPHRRHAADVLAAALPRASRAEIENGGHLCNLCAPDAYNAMLRRFIDGLD
jgi:pimeloyl-ACP methyl ester carboxylesterase